MTERYRHIVSRFAIEGEVLSFTPCGIGLINTTLFVTTSKKEYVLQKINTVVFQDPIGVMANIAAVTEHLQNKGFPTLTFVKTHDGALYCNEDGEYYRLSEKLAGKTHNRVTPTLFEAGGEAFGAFQKALSDFDASLLTETIPHFHDTPARVEALWDAVAVAERDRLAKAVESIGIIKQFSSQAGYLISLLQSGELPLRVVHNDTKINNVLFGENGVNTVLDLDTVMPGSLLFDFGDAVRSGASTKDEGDCDFDNFKLDEERYTAFVKGFLRGTDGALTEKEKKLLPFSAFVMSFELGVRFLTDYLSGDVYFKTTYGEENLNRAKGQLALAKHIFFSLDRLSALAK